MAQEKRNTDTITGFVSSRTIVADMAGPSITAREPRPQELWPRDVLLVLLTINVSTVAILRAIQTILFTLGEMAIVFGFIDAFAFRDVGIMGLIGRRLLAAHGAVFKALIDAGLLVVEPLIDFIHARMIGNLLRNRDRGSESRAA